MRLTRRRALLGAILAVVALGAAALGWFPQGPLRRLLESRLQELVGPGSRVGAVRVVPGRLSAEIRGLVLDAPTYRLQADRVTVALSRRTLAREGLFVDRLEMEGGTILLRTPASPQPPSAPPGGPIVIRDIRIANATVRYESSGAGALVLRQVDVRGSLGEGSLEATAAGGLWDRPRPVALGPLHARLRVSPRLAVRLEALDGGLERSRIQVAGDLGRVGDVRPDLAFTLRADLAEVQDLAGIAPASGIVRGEGRVRGSVDALVVEAQIQGERIRAAGWPLERLVAEVTHDVAARASTTSASVGLLGGQGRIEARLEGTDVAGRLTLAGVDLGRLQRQLGRAASVTGRASAVMGFEGDVKDVALTGRIESTVGWTGAQGPEPLDIAADVRARGSRVLAKLRLSGLGGEAEGSVDAQGSRVRALDLRGQGFDVARLAKGARGQAEFQLQATGPVEALSGTGRVGVAHTAWRGMDLGPLEADLEAQRGDLEVRASLPELAITAVTRVASGKRATGTVTLSATPLAAFSSLLPPERPLQGAVSATASFDVPLRAPADATVRGRVDALEARSGELAARAQGPFTITYERQRIGLQDVRLIGRGFDVQVAGGLGLDTASLLALEVAGEADLAALPVPAGWKTEGRARMELKVEGTRAAPRVLGFTVLNEAVLSSSTVPPLRVQAGRIDLTGDAIVIPGLRAELAEGALELRGRAPVASFWPAARRRPGTVEDAEQAHVELTWSGLQAAALLRHLRPQQPASLEGTLEGAMELEGGLASLGELRATLRLPRTTARMQDLALELAPADIVLRDGRVSSEKVELRAAGGTLTIAGGLDVARRSVDVSGHGALDLHVLSPFLEETALTGTAQMDLRVGGTLDAPRAQGTLAVRDGTARMRVMPQALTGLSADVAFDGATVRLESAAAAFAGGRLSAEGTARLAGAQGIADAHLSLHGRDLAVRYPAGMRSRLEADLTLTGRTGAFQLAGDVKALRGLFDLDTALEESLTTRTQESVPSPLMRSIGLDVRVATEAPVLVRSNMARLQAVGRLTVRGDMETPAPIGTLDVEPGGKVILQGRDFAVGSGRLVYSGTWDPELALEASARIPDYDRQTGGKRADVDVTVGLEGRMLSPRFTLRSQPAYSRAEILSLIASGDSQNPNARLAVAGPAAALLAGRLTRGVRGLGLGIDEVTIQPELVAKEGTVETGARFTFGKRLSSRVNLVYSLSLQDPEGRFVQVEGTPGRELTLSVRRTDEGLFQYGAGQRFRFGGGTGKRAEADEQRVRVVEVRLEGDRPLEPEDLRSVIKTAVGDRKTAWDLQDDADRLRERLVERGYLEAEVGGRFDGQAAVFTVRSGAKYDWTVEGMDGAPDLTRVVRSSLFEEEALERGRARLLETLRGRGHLRARVEARAEPVDGGRRLAFRAQPGPVLLADVRFAGAQELSPGRLLEAAGGAGRLLSDPDQAVADLRAAYRAAHFLAAEVDAPQVTPDGGTLTIVVPVREGPRARLAAVRVEGATLSEGVLLAAAALPAGGVYHEGDALAAGDRLRGYYYGLGYPAVRAASRLEPRGHDLDLVFQVTEGERVTVAAVVLKGMRRTREGLVRKQVRLRPGDPLDLRKVAELERRLLDLGLFARAAATVSEDNPATVTVTLEEGERFRAGYLLGYNNEDGGRAELDAETRGLFGAGVAVGGRLSLGKDLRDVRGYVNVPGLLPTGRLTLSVFRLAEDLPLAGEEESGETFARVQVGGQVQATRPLGSRFNLLYGYHLKHSTVTSPFLTSSRRVAALDLSLLRDTRDDPLDARRGRFLSLSLEAAPRLLGSDFDFVKGLAQVFVSSPFAERWTWAQGYRLGMARPFHGEPLVSDEGFEAGGANSIRGFGLDEVGPADYPFGKEVVIVLNQELRYHHPSGLGGVVFWDAGNTFATASDLSLDLRHALGAGLRWSSPVGLLRLDLGLPLSRHEGESAYQLFFSFGQAF